MLYFRLSLFSIYVYSAPVTVASCLSICLSVYVHISGTMPNFLHIVCRSFWWCCNMSRSRRCKNV